MIKCYMCEKEFIPSDSTESFDLYSGKIFICDECAKQYTFSSSYDQEGNCRWFDATPNPGTAAYYEQQKLSRSKSTDGVVTSAIKEVLLIILVAIFITISIPIGALLGLVIFIKIIQWIDIIIRVLIGG